MSESEDTTEDSGENVRDAATVVNFVDSEGESIYTIPVTSFPYPDVGEEIELEEISLISEDDTEDSQEEKETCEVEEDSPFEEFGTFIVKDLKRTYTHVESENSESIMVVANIIVEEIEESE